MTTISMVIVSITGVLVVGGALLIRTPSTTKPQDEAIQKAGTIQQPIESLKEVQPKLDAPAAKPDRQPQEGTKSILKIDLPKPFPGGTQKDIRSPNLEPESVGKNREPIQVPPGTKLLSKNCKVTSSDTEPIIGELAFVTDGEKEHDASAYVELGLNIQWVQIDLAKEMQLFAACIWHYHGDARVYRDVICQISNDKDFIDGVQTVFNNDHDNSSKLGKGTDKEYIDTNLGRPFPISGVKGRYVRFYSNGNTSNQMNHYTEIEIYGKEI
jgi:hypothetical protein